VLRVVIDAASKSAKMTHLRQNVIPDNEILTPKPIHLPLTGMIMIIIIIIIIIIIVRL